MKKILSVLLIALTVISSNVFVFAEGYENEIWKNASDWAFSELNEANEKGIIPDILIGKDFTQNITREEFASICVKAYEKLANSELSEGSDFPFSDTDGKDVKKAYNAGFTTGVSETVFSPDSNITREQGATMLCRVCKKYEIVDWSIKNDVDFETKNANFKDNDQISDWAENSVWYMNENNIINGVDSENFSPKSEMTREASLLIANRILKKYENKEKNDEVEENGNSDEKETYTVAFIGGSLTEGGTVWINDVRDYLSENMPEKNIKIINAGIGGTMSDYGAVRFSSHVLSKNPDLVFIEFSVNDRAQNELFCKAYIESMIRQASIQKKVPSVVILHAPLPIDDQNSAYDTYKKGINAKNSIANGYGLSNVNVYEYLTDVYKIKKNESSNLTFDDFLKQYYNKSGDGYDVHPKTAGYKLYGKAITEAFDNNFEAMLSKPKKRGIMTSEASDKVTATYTSIPVTSSKMRYTKGEWNTYTTKNKFLINDSKAAIPNSRYSLFPEGIRMLYKTKSEQFGFYSRAKAVYVSYFSATAGMSATVYLDDKQIGTITTKSPYHGQNYITQRIELPNDGKEHKVIFKVSRSTESEYVFSFGCIYEEK